MMRLKENPVRSKDYLGQVKELPCCNCFAPADDAHHIIGEGQGGMGTKACDLLTMPLCRGCHTQIHNQSGMWDMQWKWVAQTQQSILKKAFAEGGL